MVPVLVSYVQPLVLCKERLIGERLATLVTCERLFSGVCSDVRCQALLTLDTFATVRALVRSFPRVADHVLL